MVDVKYLYGFVRDLVKNFIWIPNERNHADAGALCHLLRTHWPHADTALYTLKSLLKRRGYVRIIGSDKRQNLIQIAQRLVRIDDFHLTAMLGNDPLDLLVGGKSAFPCGLKSTINPFELFRCCVVRPAPETCVDLKRDLSKLLLGLFGPGLNPLHRLFQCF